ncbi:sugar ABC transporter substrate-binding protein [Cohnella candidum]|uniref:Sugar ABC transporter substrate-binding protein n=1 Tax=Cohnella candidum TaxID=2674991 RepID=A0A3G3JTN8_9BACL|nr:substrate-binding domain-containing protein [Cohnella candidum]AYQ71588.1 sugar ABC transporter substrate-binding protein [Cohnella candidum]
MTTTVRPRRASGFLLALLALLAIAALSACSGSETGNDSSAAASPPAPTKTGKPQLTFGIIYPITHPYYELMTEYAEKEAEPLGVKLVVKAPDEANLEQQIRMMETMIKQRVNAIAIDPVDSDALVPVINKAVENGIPVICFESDSPGSKRLGYVGTDQRQAGIRLGQLLDKQLQGRGMVLVETGMGRMQSLKLRLDGLLSYLNANTDIQVLEVRYNEGSDAKALSDLEQMIDEHPHFDAFASLDVVSGPQSVLVWKAQGLNRYSFTFGLTDEIREALSNGQITAAVSLNEAEMSRHLVQRLMDAAQGKPVPPIEDTGLSEVNKETVSR